MGVSQRIQKAVYAPDRSFRSQLYAPLLAGNAANQTPAFTGTVIGQNVSEMLNNFSKNMLQFVNHYQGLEIQTQQRADDNAMTMANVYYREQQAAFAPQISPEKGKRSVEKALYDFKSYSASLEGVSMEGRTRLEEFQKVVTETFKSKQRFGRMKLVEQQSEAIHRTNLQKSVESGDANLVNIWADEMEKNNYQLKTDRKTLLSNTAFFKIKNRIQDYTVTDLKIEDELLQEVNDKGNSHIFKGMNVDDVRRARREVSGLMAQRQYDNYTGLVKDIESGKAYSIEDIQELYKDDKISLKVLQGFKKNYASGKKTNTDKLKNELDFTIYKASQLVDPIQKLEHYNSLKEKVLASSLDIPAKISMAKEIDRLQAAANKPGSDKNVDNTIYAVQQLKEKVYDELKVFETKERWWWADGEKEHEKKSAAMQTSELAAAKRWIIAAPRTLPEIDAYVADVSKKHGEKITVEGFRAHFAGARPEQISKIMGSK